MIYMIPYLNYYILIGVLLFGIIIYYIKRYIGNHIQRIEPGKARETESFDGHICYSSYEVIVDNFLYANKILHKRPTTAKYGEYFTNSDGVPNFVVFKDIKLSEIDSIIELTGVEVPRKIHPINHSQDVVPKISRVSTQCGSIKRCFMEIGWL